MAVKAREYINDIYSWRKKCKRRKNDEDIDFRKYEILQFNHIVLEPLDQNLYNTWIFLLVYDFFYLKGKI